MESTLPPSSINLLSPDKFFAVWDVLQADLRAAKTPEQFDEAIMILLLFVHEQVPNEASAARMIGAFMRGVLEGAGCGT